MRKFLYRIFFLFMLLLSGCSIRITEAPYDENIIWGFGNSESFKYFDDEFTSRVRILAGTDNIFSSKYIEQASAYLDKLKASDKYSINHPLFVYNPYGIMNGVLYVYMGEGNKNQYIKYNINVPDFNIPDFSSSCYIGSSSTGSIEGSITGVIPGRINSISIQILDETGIVLNENKYNIFISNNESYENNSYKDTNYTKESSRWEYENSILAIKEQNQNIAKLSSGLFCYYDTNLGMFMFFDNNGIKRAEIITENILDKDVMLLQADNMLFYADSKNSGVLYNRLSEMILRISIKDEYEIISYDYDEVQKQILLLCRNDEDILLTSIDVSIDIKAVLDNNSYNISSENLSAASISEEVYPTNYQAIPKLIDFCEIDNLIESDYLKKMINTFAEKKLSIHYAADKEIILFVEDKNSMIRIDNIYSKQLIRWIFSRQTDWENTPYSVMLLKCLKSHKMGNIEAMSMYNEKRLAEGCEKIGIISIIDNDIYYNKYIINENNNTYNMVNSSKLNGLDINLASGFTFYGEYIIAANNEGGFSEYDPNGELIIKYNLSTKNQGKVYKYSMSRYWF